MGVLQRGSYLFCDKYLFALFADKIWKLSGWLKSESARFIITLNICRNSVFSFADVPPCPVNGGRRKEPYFGLVGAQFSGHVRVLDTVETFVQIKVLAGWTKIAKKKTNPSALLKPKRRARQVGTFGPYLFCLLRCSALVV